MSKTHATAVTVIVSFHNSGPHLDRCLAQLRKLDLTGHELILIDDASTDDTLARLRATEFAGYVIANPTNLGIAATRNRAIALAQGEYIWLVDHDDHWEPQILDTLLRLAREFNADIAVCGADYLDGTTGKSLGMLESPRRRELINRQQAIHALLAGKLQGYSWNKLFRRSLLPQDAFATIVEPKEDLARLILTLEHCNRVALTPEVLYHHLDHDTAITRQMHPDLSPYSRCFELALQLAASTAHSHTPADTPALLRRFAYYQFIGPTIGTALSRDALTGPHADANRALLQQARNRTRLRELPSVALRFPVQAALALAFKLLGWHLFPLYRAIRPRR